MRTNASASTPAASAVDGMRRLLLDRRQAHLQPRRLSVGGVDVSTARVRRLPSSERAPSQVRDWALYRFLALPADLELADDGLVRWTLFRVVLAGPVLWLSVPVHARAEPAPTPAPWDHLGSNLAEAFGGTNLIWHGASIASTVVLAETGADYEVRIWVRQNVHAHGFSDACVVGGYVFPAVAAPSVYLIGLAAADPKTAYAGAAAVQSLTVTALTVGMLKWSTGRPHPNNGRDPEDPNALNYPEDARIASLEPFGEHWMMAWPSGHTAATLSIAAALYGFAPEDPWLGLIGYTIALGFGAGMLIGDHHWLSDVAAGGMIGHAIGYSTGRGFRRAYDASTTSNRVALYPAIQAVGIIPLASGGWGIGIAGAL